MLIKPHFADFLEDFGLLTKTGQVYLYENGLVGKKNKYNWSPVLRVHALWVDKDLRVKCEIADTPDKRKVGLANHDDLNEFDGMLFPLPGTQKASFHQGGVPFSLDIIFINDSKIQQIEQMTDPRKNAHWSCDACDMVLEVNGGFCAFNDVEVGDSIAFFAISEQDLKDFEEEQSTAHIISALVDVDE